MGATISGIDLLVFRSGRLGSSHRDRPWHDRRAGLRSPFYCRQPLSEGVHDQFLEMDAEMLAVDQELAAFRDTPQQPVLNGVGESVVLISDLFAEGDQILRKLLGYARPKIMLGEAPGLVGAVGNPNIDGEVGETRVDVNRDGWATANDTAPVPPRPARRKSSPLLSPRVRTGELARPDSRTSHAQ